MKAASNRSLLTISISCLLISGTAGAVDIHWTNTLGGVWSAVTNWSPNQVPDALDAVFISEAGTYAVTLDTNATIQSLKLGGVAGQQRLSVPQKTLRINGRSTNSENGVLDLDNGALCGDGSLHIETGAILNWFGEIEIPLNIATNGLVNLNGGSLSKSCTNFGTITWLAPGHLLGLSGAALINQPGGLIDIQNDEDISWFNGVPATNPGGIQNSGTVRKSVGTGVNYIGAYFENSGLVDIRGGEVFFDSFVQEGGSTVLNGGAISSQANEETYSPLKFLGGLLGGSGKVYGRVIVGGQLSPGSSAGRVEVSEGYGTGGKFEQGPGGSFNVEIGGLTPGIDFDQLKTMSADLEGSINVCLINGFIPNPGDRFEIVSAAANFIGPGSLYADVHFGGLNVANGLRLEPIITASNIVLVATNAPLKSSPELHLFRNGSDLWLCWPRGYETFNLEAAANLFAPDWQRVTITESNRFILQPTGSARFFRMVQP